MAKQELGINKDMLETEYQHTRYVSQMYPEATLLYLRSRAKIPPRHTLFINALKDANYFVLLSKGGDGKIENAKSSTTFPFRNYITFTPIMECFIRNTEFKSDKWKWKSGGDNEYLGEYRGKWKRGGNNFNGLKAE